MHFYLLIIKIFYLQNQARKRFLEKNNQAKEYIAQECYDYMSTSAGKEKVLNPPKRTPIAGVNWGTTDFEKEIEARVDLYVEKFLAIRWSFKKV